MNNKTLEKRQAEKREEFLKLRKENESEVKKKTADWNYRKEGDLYPKISFAFNIENGEYQVLKSSITNHQVFEGAIKEKKINKYAYFENYRESFESNLASQQKADPGIKILTEKNGEWDLIEVFYNLPSGMKRTQNKSGGRRNGRGRSWSKERIKISREALDNFDQVFIIEYQLNKGGESGGRNSQDREWNNYKNY